MRLTRQCARVVLHVFCVGWVDASLSYLLARGASPSSAQYRKLLMKEKKYMAVSQGSLALCWCHTFSSSFFDRSFIHSSLGYIYLFMHWNFIMRKWKSNVNRSHYTFAVSFKDQNHSWKHLFKIKINARNCHVICKADVLFDQTRPMDDRTFMILDNFEFAIHVMSVTHIHAMFEAIIKKHNYYNI